MKTRYTNSSTPTLEALPECTDMNVRPSQQESEMDRETLAQEIVKQLQAQIQSEGGVKISKASVGTVADRIAKEVERICRQSSRIQKSGQIRSWQLNLARHRLQKCLTYYNLGSKQGRVELHSTLGAIVYRYITPMRQQLSFQARYHLIEDFLQGFFMESLKAFRRETELPEDYTPRTSLEVAEYLSFTEQYARRRINLGKSATQQLIVLRAQAFSRRQPAETTMDMELAAESPKSEDAQTQRRDPAMQQVRASMVSQTTDPALAVLRDRLISELIQYLESQGQSDCIDYLTLKLQDLSAMEIDDVLGLSSRQRDYLQQRFKYHVEKFSRIHQWQLVHEWLGADLDRKLGMNSQQWSAFWQKLTPQQQQLLQLKRDGASLSAIATALKWTPKQVEKRWSQLLELAWQARNSSNFTQNR
ncbi:HetZ-related protein [Argonema galeatum]|uniref:HetZ-related protein n=1 Tax=Argonema galeatum TaxID=2942762 RepID=UPI002010CD13|nr:HetZ-related protein [Argonema galeatum]MCL1463032.1 HetZ-related protein [Argonema galeatum A003/A1]